MSNPKAPLPAKLVAGLLFADRDVHEAVLQGLAGHFGPFDLLTEPMPFHFTTYYDREMGPNLHRQLAAFANLVEPAHLPEIKLRTNQMELHFTRDGKRRVNIDPGILSEERLVLATGKNYTHRIYLREGIYADLTLIYQGGSYRPMPWTYPDYQEASMIHLLACLRQKLRFQRDGQLPRKQPGYTGGSA